jgi:DNA-binding beta-propeller fold protein YncE
MQQNLGLTVRIVVLLCALVCCAGVAQGQVEDELTAKARIFPGIGPGLRSVKATPDGKTYILAAPGNLVSVFGKDGKLLKTIPDYSGSTGPASAELRAIRFGESMDVDAQGTVYVADRAANAVKVWAADGTARMSPVNSPMSVAALGEGEVAVTTLNDSHLVIVFDRNGRDVREFGDPEPISDRQDLNRFLNIGELQTDGKGHLYYAFLYMPEPTVRMYDRNGYSSGQDVQYTAVEAAAEAQAVRREIVRQEKRQKSPTFKRVLTAVGVDPATGEAWMAIGSLLLRFDKEGSRRASYKLYTPEGARLDAQTILIQPDRLVIGSDPLGIYQFDRPDKEHADKEHPDKGAH